MLTKGTSSRPTLTHSRILISKKEDIRVLEPCRLTMRLSSVLFRSLTSLSRTHKQLPFIEVRVETRSHQRHRRMIGLNCEESSSEVRCCRYPLTVDFEEFGWDWIIAPKRYEANYCSGECPFVFMQKYPHTHLVQQASPAGSTGPCCTPRKMSSISMLYFDENRNIVYGILPGMVVDRCGCS